MAKVKGGSSGSEQRRTRPPITVEAKENQMGSLAMDLAEKQLREGTASSQVITHFLKLMSTKEQLEKERLKEENKLLKAKTEALEAQKESKQLYEDAIKAFKRYSGQDVGDEY